MMKCSILGKPYLGMMALGAICSFRSTTLMVLSKSGKHLIRNHKFLSTVRVHLNLVHIISICNTLIFFRRHLYHTSTLWRQVTILSEKVKRLRKEKSAMNPNQKGSFQEWLRRSQSLDSYSATELTLQWPFRSWTRVCNWAGNNLTTWNMK